MALKLSTLQVQKPILAPSLQQSIAVLLLPIMELNTAIEQELQNNPLLEQDETNPDFLENRADKELYRKAELLDNRHADHRISTRDENSWDDDESHQESPLTRTLTLEESLLKQLRMETSDPTELRTGEMIIGNIDTDGYLTATCDELAQILGMDTPEPVVAMVRRIQKFEPIGVASQTLTECLLIQLLYKEVENPNLIERIITEHFEDLGRKRHLKIARKLGVPIEDVKDAAKIIASLEPKPARNHRPIDASIYIQPDVVIKPDAENTYQIIVNKTERPPLRINPQYKRLLMDPRTTDEEKAFIREKLTNAMNFIKSINQRGQTIRKITEYILERQKDFFADGTTAIVPLCLKDIAVAIGRNESTISRAINNKYIDTPHGLYPMKFFFSQAVQSTGDDPISVQSIKDEMRELVETENKSTPLSDKEIQGHFNNKGMQLARRTVSKYRQALNIPPSYLRKE